MREDGAAQKMQLLRVLVDRELLLWTLVRAFSQDAVGAQYHQG